jgi:hypothetical protein
MSACELYSTPRFGMKGWVRGFACQDSIALGSHSASHTHLTAKGQGVNTELRQAATSHHNKYLLSTISGTSCHKNPVRRAGLSSQTVLTGDMTVSCLIDSSYSNNMER